MKNLLLVIVCTSSLISADLKNDVSNCSKLSDTVKRLERYDNTAKKHKLNIQKKTIVASLGFIFRF